MKTGNSSLAEAAHNKQTPYRELLVDRQDAMMILAIGVLLVGLAVVILRGDQVGMSAQRYGPRDSGSSQTSITVDFDEPIDPKSIDSAISVNPSVPGTLSADNQRVIFHPNQALKTGQTYTVTVKSGIMGNSGRRLKQSLTWTFSVRIPRIAYLAPVDNIVQNIYMVDPAAPDNPLQLTQTGEKQGVLGFDVSPDGSKIAYSQIDGEGTASLYLWEAATGKSSLLYECKDASCNNPIWASDGNRIAYERTDLNSGTGMAPGVPRVWVLDVAQNVAMPLFKDGQELGYSPRWSPDGSKLAVFDVNGGGIIVHDFKTGKDKPIKTVQGEIGSFSPDGKWLDFPKVVEIEQGTYVQHRVLVDVSTDTYTQHDLIPDSDAGNDVEAIWQPDSKAMIVARRTPYSRATAQGPQLYSVDVATGKAIPLVVDENYSHGNAVISPIGDAMVFQRFSLTQPGARPEIWVYNLTTNDVKKLVTNAASPHWMP